MGNRRGLLFQFVGARTQKIPEENFQKKLGHRNIVSITIYESSLPNQEVETYVSKIAGSDEEKLKLFNLGFQYTGLNTNEGLPIMTKEVVGFDRRPD